MAYPLTGAARSATTKTVLPFAAPMKIAPTRVAGGELFATYPLSGYSRSVPTKVAPLQPARVKVKPLRQWGLAPSFEVLADSWGVF